MSFSAFSPISAAQRSEILFHTNDFWYIKGEMRKMGNTHQMFGNTGQQLFESVRWSPILTEEEAPAGIDSRLEASLMTVTGDARPRAVLTGASVLGRRGFDRVRLWRLSLGEVYV